jgi:hypothetical protein
MIEGSIRADANAAPSHAVNTLKTSRVLLSAAYKIDSAAASTAYPAIHLKAS